MDASKFRADASAIALNAGQSTVKKCILPALPVVFAVAIFSLSTAMSTAAFAAPAEIDQPVTEPKTNDAPLPMETPAPISKGYLSSRFAQMQGDTGNALHYIRDALKLDPNNAGLLTQAYHLLLVKGEFTEAVGIAKKIPDENHRSLDPAVLLALAEVEKGDYKTAQKLIADVPTENFNSILIPLMREWLKAGDAAAKQPVTEASLGEDAGGAGTAFVNYQLALLNDVQGNEEGAAKYYALAVQDAGKMPYRLVEASINYYLRKGDEKRAGDIIAAYLETNPEASFMRDIRSLSQHPNPDPLVKSAREGLAELFYSMGNLLYSAGATDDEQIYLHLALHLRPGFAAAQYLLATALERESAHEAAIAMYQKIDAASPYYQRAQIRSAYNQELLGNTDAALKQLEAISAVDPTNIDTYLTIGDILRNKSRFAEAAAAYDKAIARIEKPQKNDWAIYYSRAVSNERAGAWAAAEPDFLKALELEPGQPDVLNYLGYSWLVMGKNIEQAREMVEQALAARPDDVQIIDSMGWALYTTGDYENALDYLEQAVELEPNDPTINEHLGDVYWRLGRKKEARYQWERALVFKPTAKQEQEIRDKIERGMADVPASRSMQTVEDKLRSAQQQAQ